MRQFHHRKLDYIFYSKLEEANEYSDYVFKSTGYICCYEVFDTCVKLSLDVAFPDGEIGLVEAIYYTTEDDNAEFIELLYQTKAFDSKGNISFDTLKHYKFDVCIGRCYETNQYEVQELIVNEESYWDLMDRFIDGNLSERCIVGECGKDFRNPKCNKCK